MRSKKSLLKKIHPKSGKSFINVLLIFIFLWILARPLKYIGQDIYLYSGGFLNKTIHSVLTSKSNIEKVVKSKDILQRKNQKIAELLIENNFLKNQNKKIISLKEQLNLKQNLHFKTRSATIIGRTPDNWHKQIILDSGSNSNIQIGNSVLSSKGVVGQIVEVNKNTSIAQLISDQGFKIGCKVVGKNISGILYGKSGKIGLLHFIPVGTDIKKGDIVVASGISTSDLFPVYPAGHPIGKVYKVSKRKVQSSDLYIEVKLFENLNSLNTVLIFSPG